MWNSRSMLIIRYILPRFIFAVLFRELKFPWLLCWFPQCYVSTVSSLFPTVFAWCFHMCLTVFLRFPLVFPLFPVIVSLVSFFRLCLFFRHIVGYTKCQFIEKYVSWKRSDNNTWGNELLEQVLYANGHNEIYFDSFGV